MNLSLKFWSSPKAIQSVRFARIGNYVRTYQPAHNKDWKNWVKMQAQGQLSANFRPICDMIAITKLHYSYGPLKSFPKYKIKKLNEGAKYYKKTRPDMCDNLKKGIIDALTGIVWTDDSLIVSENNIKKFFSTEPYVILEIETIEDELFYE